MCPPQVIHYSNGKELTIDPGQKISDEVLYSPEDDHELHYARISPEPNGEVSVNLLCGLDAGNIEKGLFFETTEDGINYLLSYCGYCFMN